MQPEDMSHQAMGYDRTSTMFSPDGRLLQVEYAKKTVKQGTTAVGVVFKDGVLMVADKRVVEKLMIGKSVEKVYQVDDHIGATASGILSDGRILIERAQVLAQQHRITYNEPMTTESLVKDICNLKQLYTQVGGARPFGVSIMFIGVGNNPHLFVTDPTGIFFEYKATAIGEADNQVKEMLNKQFKDNMSFDDAAKIAVKALKTALGKDFSLARLDGAYILKSDKQFKRFTSEEFSKFSK
jgi:proteasome alpha subunit